MEIEQIRDTAINLHALKYKAMAVGSIIIGLVLLAVGIATVFKNSIMGVIIILFGLLAISGGVLSFKSARRKAEIKGGLHGSLAQHRLMKREREMKKKK